MNSIKGMPCSAICLIVLQQKMRKRVETGGGGGVGVGGGGGGVCLKNTL